MVDYDVLSGTEDDCVSPTTQLHVTNGTTRDSLATSTSEIISKLDGLPETTAEIIILDVGVMS